jgi:hypothetical protein
MQLNLAALCNCLGSSAVKDLLADQIEQSNFFDRTTTMNKATGLRGLLSAEQN